MHSKQLDHRFPVRKEPAEQNLFLIFANFTQVGEFNYTVVPLEKVDEELLSKRFVSTTSITSHPFLYIESSLSTALGQIGVARCAASFG
jgi:hypothetical protein